jgi:23S rRNA pseudouridine1911/1915/1917 synthase
LAIKFASRHFHMPSSEFAVTSEEAGQTLAALLRRRMPGQSWTQVRRVIERRRVQISGQLCLDPARRLQEKEVVEILECPAPTIRREPLVIRYVDQHLIVVEKPAGISTVRHPAERDWPRRRKALSPTLEDLVITQRASEEKPKRKGTAPRLRVVQRLDKETSGLVVFAKTVSAERGLGQQFRAHTVTRRYLAIIPGYLPSQTISTRLVPDRGDGRRGSTKLPGLGKEAITHVEVIERLGKYTLLSCRLETGRTHQIRIHLAELGHPICGEKVYNLSATGQVRDEQSAAPRLALHASELGFVHPVTGRPMQWKMPLPDDLEHFLRQLRGSAKRPSWDLG